MLIPDELRRSADEKTTLAYERIVAAHPWLLPEGPLIRALHRIVETAASVRSRYRKFVQFADRINAAIEPHAQCKRGCAHCCHIAVSLTETEAELIGEAIGQRPAAPTHFHALTAPQGFDPGESKVRYFGKPCPFLDGQVCSIYENRPIACRLHHNLGEVFFCRTDVPIAENGVSSLDTMALTGAMTAMFIRKNPSEKFADLREFFPRKRSDAA